MNQDGKTNMGMLKESPGYYFKWMWQLVARLVGYDIFYFVYSCYTWFVYKLLWPSPLAQWRRLFTHAQNYDDWQEAADNLNCLLDLDAWRFDARSRHYNRELIMGHIDAMDQTFVQPDGFIMSELFRSGLHRNLGNITAPTLYKHCFGRTKFVIETFSDKMVTLLHLILQLPRQPSAGLQDAARFMPSDMKMDFVVASRRALGCSSLLLEGGAMFGICHLGVTRALYQQDLLPRIITGVETGSLLAALIAVTSPQNLPALLDGHGIDISALNGTEKWQHTWIMRLFKLVSQMIRYCRKGYFWDVDALEECALSNLGEITFAEAHDKSNIILNIIVPVPGDKGVPILLNYLTAPNVLIWTAAVASNSASQSFTGGRRTTIMCKDHNGNIMPWDHNEMDEQPYDRMRPLDIIARSFNVNHFVISQARPYVLPFIQSETDGPDLRGSNSKLMKLVKHLARIVGAEVHLRIEQLNTLGLLPTFARQLFLHVDVHHKPHITIVPDMGVRDYLFLLDPPSKESVRYWIHKGETAVWPLVCALRVRLQLEAELEKAYMMVRNELPENDAFL
ncbi:hypothetical protein BROUX41_000862 [Berkeleyomyces rouxiae]|uniref:uncharacterized protein n=1 Tax=Berkeleyomyces rouxiae TaxID=2035830 RepID=UPI003B7E9021